MTIEAKSVEFSFNGVDLSKALTGFSYERVPRETASTDGVSFPGPAQPIQPIPIAAAEIQMDFVLPNARSFHASNDMLSWCDRKVAEVLIGRGVYRERNGNLERLANAVPLAGRVGPVRFERANLWEKIGTTRGRFAADNRLRKFIWRRGQIAEVRARGRIGHRSLRDAVEAAVRESPAVSMGAQFTIEADSR